MQDTKQATTPSQEQLDQYAHLWDVRNEKERETLKLVALQYGLDPLTREVMMIHGQVYVTAAGLQKLALRDPDYDGCEVDIIEARWDQDFFVVKARVWKKGCNHPFEDYGDADPSTSKLKGHALFRHAITRARARAMRSAFAIPFCSIEELDDEQRFQWIAQQQQRAQHTEHEPLGITEKQRNALLGLLRQLSFSRAAFGAELDRRFGASNLDDLTRSQASTMIQELSERAKEQETEEPAKEEPAKEEPVAEIAPHDSTEVSATAQVTQEVAIAEAEATEIATAPESSASTPQHIEVAEAPKETPVKEKPARDAQGRKAGRNAQAEPQTKTSEKPVPAANPEESAQKILRSMQRARSLEDLRDQWESFKKISDQLPHEWVDRIQQTKDQRKAALG